MATEQAAPLDRRQRRRLESIEEVLDVAAEVMAEQGAAGLSIGEVARRIGIRPPSLYVYFESKNALYDALFERGCRDIYAFIESSVDGLHAADDVKAYLLRWIRAMVRWCVEHQAYAQLMFWRPVPGYEPSATAYEPAVKMVDRARAEFSAMQQQRLLRDDVDAEDILRVWTILSSGVMSQQLANAPRESFEDGTFTAALPTLVDMFVTQFAPPRAAPTQRRKRHADNG